MAINLPRNFIYWRTRVHAWGKKQVPLPRSNLTALGYGRFLLVFSTWTSVNYHDWQHPSTLLQVFVLSERVAFRYATTKECEKKEYLLENMCNKRLRAWQRGILLRAWIYMYCKYSNYKGFLPKPMRIYLLASLSAAPSNYSTQPPSIWEDPFDWRLA